MIPSLILVGIYVSICFASASFVRKWCRRCRQDVRDPISASEFAETAWCRTSAACADLHGAGHDPRRLATPTEGGSMGAVGALALTIIHRRMSWKPSPARQCTPPLKLTTMVMFILVGSTVFCLTFRGRGGRSLDRRGFLSHFLPGGICGAFLVSSTCSSSSWRSSSTISRSPSSSFRCSRRCRGKMGIDLIWFGVLICVNMQTSFMHPPFGFALFFCARSRRPRSRAKTSYRARPLRRHHVDHGRAGASVSRHGVGAAEDNRR